jgi:hypothetical protein
VTQWWYEAVAPTTWSTWVLVIAAILAFWAAIRTLTAIRGQIGITIDSERAWILVEIGEIQPTLRTDLQSIWLTPIVKNYGKTSGRIQRVSATSRTVSSLDALPAVPEYGKENSFDFILAPSVPIRPMTVVLPGRELQNVVEGKNHVCIYGFIDYLDVGNVQRKTRFCFAYYVPPDGGVGSTGFYVAAEMPTIYNLCT